MNMYIYKFCPKMLSLQAAHLVLEQSSCLYCMIKLFHMYAMSTSTNIFQQDIHVSSINQKQIIGHRESPSRYLLFVVRPAVYK